MSVGRLQEYETLQIEGAIDDYSSFVWVRRPPTAINSPDHSADEVIENSENEIQYKLTKRDVGLHICVRLSKDQATEAPAAAAAVPSSSSSGGAAAVSYTASLGPVLPGPPRILDFTVTGSLEVGTSAVACYEYIGGFEGVSEVWWMRIRPDGKREQISAETGTGEGVGGGGLAPSREYTLTEGDVGCTLKAKVRPARSDGVKGEIFTSKSSGVVRVAGETRGDTITTAAEEEGAGGAAGEEEETVMEVEEKEESSVVPEASEENTTKGGENEVERQDKAKDEETEAEGGGGAAVGAVAMDVEQEDKSSDVAAGESQQEIDSQ